VPVPRPAVNPGKITIIPVAKLHPGPTPIAPIAKPKAHPGPESILIVPSVPAPAAKTAPGDSVNP